VADPRTVIIDFETYYSTDKADPYTLRKMSTPEYIHDRRFKVHGLAVDLDGKQDFIRPAGIPKFLKSVQNDILVAHNMPFDGGILAWHYEYRPAFMLCTLQIANHVLGSARGSGHRNDLASLAERLRLPAGSKGKMETDGQRDLDEAQLLALGAYAMQDARLCRGVLDELLPHVSNQELEFWLLDHTLRIYTEKLLAIDTDKLKSAAALIDQARKTTVAAGNCDPKVLASNKQFAVELEARLRRAKMTLPKKRGKKGMIPAVAKGDPAFVALTECKDEDVSNLVKARLCERSAITVAARLGTMRTVRRHRWHPRTACLLRCSHWPLCGRRRLQFPEPYIPRPGC
jgi:DNA polymerase III epsilon subunit-like protein